MNRTKYGQGHIPVRFILAKKNSMLRRLTITANGLILEQNKVICFSRLERKMYYVLNVLIAAALSVYEFFAIPNVQAKWAMILLTIIVALLRYSFTLGRDMNECFNGHSVLSFYDEYCIRSDALWFTTIWLLFFAVLLVTTLFTPYSVSMSTVTSTTIAFLVAIPAASLLATKRQLSE